MKRLSPQEVFRTRTIRLYPTPVQAERLAAWAGAVRFVYNLALEQRKTYWRKGRRFNYVTQGRELKALRADVAWIADVPANCLHQALKDLDSAYRNWWEGRSGPPNFRRRGRREGFRFHQPRDWRLARTTKRSGSLSLPKIGGIRMRWSGLPVGDARQLTIVRRGERWFAILMLRQSLIDRPAPNGAVGIDRGVSIFAALSTGELIFSINPGGKLRPLLGRAQRRLARKKKGSENYRKQRQRVARLHMRVANARRNFSHSVSTNIVKSHDTVVIEKLKVQNMTRSAAGTAESPGRNVRAKSGLNRSILDQGWGMFRFMLSYKLEDRGGRLVEVPANDTSRTCAECGVIDGASRKAQRFVCTACGHEAHADTNAAINILRRAGSSVLPVEGGQACGPVEAGTIGGVA